MILTTKIKQQNKIPKLRFPGFSGEWEEKRLGEVATFLKGKGISKNDIVENGKNKCIRYGELYTEYKEIIDEVKSQTDLSKNNSVLSGKNDLLIPSSGETPIDIATTSCIHQEGVFIGGDINILRLKNSCGDFFAYYLSNYKRRDIARLAQGHSVVHLYSSSLKTLRIFIPSLPEQQKIAGFLGAVDERIEILKKKREALKKYKKGIMQKIFPAFANATAGRPAKGEKNPQIRFKDDNGKDFPEWEEERLGEVVQLSTASYVPVDMNLQEGYYLVDMGSVLASGKLLTKKRTKKADSILKKGDLVMPNRDIGRGDIIGKVAYIDDDNRYVLGSNMYKLSILYNIKLSSMFLFYLINNSEINRVMRRRANGTSQLQLVRKDIESVNILIPSFTEQQKIANFLSAIDKKIELVEAQIQKMQEWKKGLMQGLFV